MTDVLQQYIESLWDESIIDTLREYIAIPNKSPMFDSRWQENGYMEQAIQLAWQWCQQHPLKNMHMEIVRLPGRTPLLWVDVPGENGDPVLLYGHLDKQPEMEGWEPELGPWKPVLRDDKLYGRGGADDGYALFSSFAAIAALQAHGVKHRRCMIIIECCEESGSEDLPYYIDALKDKIGQPSLVICLDSGCGNYEQLWLTTSLRGVAGGTLCVEVLSEGVHSGDASGVIASSFRITRMLLDRLENAETGEIIPPQLHGDIPPQRRQQAAEAGDLLRQEVYRKFPLKNGIQPTDNSMAELILRRTWKPALSITGCGDIPPLESAGNVLRPKTRLKISMRLPPQVDAVKATAVMKTILEQDPPYGAKVTFTPDQSSSGWHAPPLSPRLQASVDTASQTYFGKPAVHMGEGGTIPFMAMLGEKFPGAQFVITGVLGPRSNAHGPNEFLHIPMAKKLTCCVARIVADHVDWGAKGDPAS